jgi:hypothetical protein
MWRIHRKGLDSPVVNMYNVESRLPGGAYNVESLLSCREYNVESLLPCREYTAESRLPGLFVTSIITGLQKDN